MAILQTGHRRRGSGLTTDMIPDLERAIILARHKNRTVYVDSAAATGGNGDSWGGAYVTLALALAAALAGDTILIAPGHAESVATAAGLASTKAGVKVIGVGAGRQRPVITFTSVVGASWDITAANVYIENLCFKTTIDAQTTMFNISAADCQIVGCEFVTGDATNQILVGVLTTAAADRFVFESNFVYGSADAGTTNFLQLIGGDGIRIVDNTFIGNYSTGLGPINNITTAMTNGVIRNNILWNRTASSTKVIVLLSTSTVVISGNGIQILSGTAPITGAAAMWVGSPANYYAATIATGSTIV